LAQRTTCNNPVLNIPNPYNNYSYINPTDPTIENFRHNDKLLCDTIIKYYIRPKFGLLNTTIAKYNINLANIDDDDIHTDPSAQDPDTQAPLNGTQNFRTFFFIKFNRYFDINDYQKINQINSLLPTDPFNTRLYDNIIMAVLNKFNNEYIRKYAVFCLKGYKSSIL
jgi:hypothetical protein